MPSPPHVVHAPNGELNEKWRGSSSGIEMPQTGQPYFSENVSTDRVSALNDLDEALGELERRLERVGEAAAILGAHDEPVDDDGDRVVLPPVELRRIGELDQLAVDVRRG